MKTLTFIPKDFQCALFHVLLPHIACSQLLFCLPPWPTCPRVCVQLAEKSVLLRELQSHLASSRQELHLKDETLSKVTRQDSLRKGGVCHCFSQCYVPCEIEFLNRWCAKIVHCKVKLLMILTSLRQLEKKLDSVRREGGHNGERMQYLTGQLTSLQLEVGRTHGQAEHLRRQVFYLEETTLILGSADDHRLICVFNYHEILKR